MTDAELLTETMLRRLRKIVVERARLEKERDEVVRFLMTHDPRVARKMIAEAADVSEPRLYQIRDGRR
jgi:hypothetical protein